GPFFFPGQELVKIRDRVQKTLAQGHLRLPAAELFIRNRNIWLALLGVVLRQREVLELRFRSSQLENGFSKLADGEFSWISKVDGAEKLWGAFHQSDDALNQVVHVTEGPRLTTIAID